MEYYGANEIGTKKSCMLLTSITDCLYQCMVHDSEGLFQKEVFRMVMQPVVDQVCNYVALVPKSAVSNTYWLLKRLSWLNACGLKLMCSLQK